MSNEKGFTFIELLVVIAIIGILAAVAVPKYKDAVVKGKESVLKENLWNLRSSIIQFKTKEGRYPADLNELVEKNILDSSPDSWTSWYHGHATWWRIA